MREISFSTLTKGMEPDVADWFIDTILDKGGVKRDMGNYADRIRLPKKTLKQKRRATVSVNVGSCRSMLSGMMARSYN